MANRLPAPLSSNIARDFENIDPATFGRDHVEDLLAIVDAAIDIGERDDIAPPLRGKARLAYEAHHREVDEAREARLVFLGWLMPALCATEVGAKRCIAIALDDSVALDSRVLAATALADGPHRTAFAERIDLGTWSDEFDYQQLQARFARAIFWQDKTAAFERLSPFVHARRNGESVLLGAPRSKKSAWQEVVEPNEYAPGQPEIDDRWYPLLLELVADEELDHTALLVLASIPIDERALDAVLRRYGPDPAAAHYDDPSMRVLARIANEKAIPYLLAALQSRWTQSAAAFHGLGRTGDPTMAHAIREWLDKNADEHEALGRRMIEKLERMGAVPKPDKPFFPDRKKRSTSSRKRASRP